MTKSNNKNANEFKRIARISVWSCYFVNPYLAFPPYQNLSSPTGYQTAPPSTPIVLLPLSPITSPRISPSKLLTTPKSNLSPLTSPPPGPLQPSKQSSPLAINLDPVELTFYTPLTSPNPFFDSLEDIPLRTNNPQPQRSLFDTIDHLANQSLPLPAMEPPLLPLSPQLLPLGPNNPFPMLTYDMFCNHCQRTQVIVNDLRKEMRFILNHILEHLDPEWSRHVTIVHQTKDLHTADYTQLYDFLKYNQKEIAQPGMNMGQDRQMQMVGGNSGNQFRQYAGQNARNLNGNGPIGVQGNKNQNQIGNGNLVAVRAKGNAPGHNGNQIRCYNCRGVGHFARDCTIRPRRRDAVYLQTQLLIAQKEEAGIQLQAE
nr:hypothetical protein [Tanacetum cinerariifolium]